MLKSQNEEAEGYTDTCLCNTYAQSPTCCTSLDIFPGALYTAWQAVSGIPCAEPSLGQGSLRTGQGTFSCALRLPLLEFAVQGKICGRENRELPSKFTFSLSPLGIHVQYQLWFKISHFFWNGCWAEIILTTFY